MSRPGKTHWNNVDPVTRYCQDHTSALLPDEEELIKKTMEDPYNVMMASADQLQFLANICRAMGAKKTLDVGVYTGFSSLLIAKALPDDGKVVACDITDEYLEEYCIPAWTRGGVRHKIDFRVGPAVDTLESLVADNQCGTFDFAFIDADKVSYRTYFELCLKLLRRGGIIAFDNVLWLGKVLPNSGADDEVTNAVRELNDALRTDDRISLTMLSVGDGTSIALKK